MKLGLAEGEFVWVESPYGKACFKLKIADMGDDAEDLAHALSLALSQVYVSQFQSEVMAPKRLLAWADATGIVVNTPPNLKHDPLEVLDA